MKPEDGSSAPFGLVSPRCPGRAQRHGELERDSLAGAGEGNEPACRLYEVPTGLAHVEEDFDACGATGVSAEPSPASAGMGGGVADHSRDPGGRRKGPEEATAYGEADLRAAEDRVRISDVSEIGIACSSRLGEVLLPPHDGRV